MLENVRERLLSGESNPERAHYEAPCDKKDCAIYSIWVVKDDAPIAYKLSQDSKPSLISFRDTSCLICKHFKPFDLYRSSSDPRVEAWLNETLSAEKTQTT